jgi:hypothetical protein
MGYPVEKGKKLCYKVYFIYFFLIQIQLKNLKYSCQTKQGQLGH